MSTLPSYFVQYRRYQTFPYGNAVIIKGSCVWHKNIVYKFDVLVMEHKNNQ